MNDQTSQQGQTTEQAGQGVFRFSPRPNRAAEINWQPWSQSAFKQAKRENRPVLLNLTAIWCHWCHVMDETTYSDPEVIETIRQSFVPVRVDADQNPHIQERYIAGGWPTNSFLTPEGDVILAGTYIPPDTMKEYMAAVLKAWKEGREQLEARLQDLRKSETGLAHAAELSGGVPKDAWQTALALVKRAHDHRYGGFGSAPKFPHPDAVELLLHAASADRDGEALTMAASTLKQMSESETYDPEEGGLFRYATRRDWSVPHYEKMLETNAALLDNLTLAWCVAGEEWITEVAQGVANYLLSVLARPEYEGFYGSQDADEHYYKLDREKRRSEQRPFVDDTVHCDWNGMACRALIRAGTVWDQAGWTQAALKTLEWIRRTMWSEEGVHHFFRDGKPGGPAGLLDDNCRLGLAFLTAYEATGDRRFLSDARGLAVSMTDQLEDPVHGGFYDAPADPEAIGALARRDKRIFSNATAARFLWRLAAHLDDDWYAREALRALENFAGEFRDWGFQSASYGLAACEVLGQATKVAVVGEPRARRELVKSAFRLAPQLGLVVHPLDPAEELEWGAQEYPASPAPAAYVCVGSACRGPATTPAELQRLIAPKSHLQ